jgi:hypothetical protein
MSAIAVVEYEEVEENNEIDVAEGASAIIELRTAREHLAAEYEAEDNRLKAQMKVIEASLLQACNKISASSINTKYGTVIRKLSERYICSDWGNFYDFEAEHREYDFRERRIHQGNMKTFLAEHPVLNDGLPPGMSVMREYQITVRKPTK